MIRALNASHTVTLADALPFMAPTTVVSMLADLAEAADVPEGPALGQIGSAMAIRALGALDSLEGLSAAVFAHNGLYETLSFLVDAFDGKDLNALAAYGIDPEAAGALLAEVNRLAGLAASPTEIAEAGSANLAAQYAGEQFGWDLGIPSVVSSIAYHVAVSVAGVPARALNANLIGMAISKVRIAGEADDRIGRDTAVGFNDRGHLFVRARRDGRYAVSLLDLNGSVLFAAPVLDYTQAVSCVLGLLVS